MTKEELLAMPDSDYMNEKQLIFFKNLLIAERERYCQGIANLTKETMDAETLNTSAPDPIDRQVGLEHLNRLTIENQRVNKLVNDINIALKKIEEGDYGYCEISGEPIGLKRLLTLPSAKYTTDEQERLEKQQKHFR